jgi:pentatricopeptide repeat protein
VRFFTKAPCSGFAPNCVTYSTVISGCVKLGDLERALELFDEMLRSGVLPDVVCCNLLIDGFFKEDKLDKAIEVGRCW